jgi:hypothetical protein
MYFWKGLVLAPGAATGISTLAAGVAWLDPLDPLDPCEDPTSQ